MKLFKPSQRWVEWGIPAAILLLNIIYKILFLGARDITIDEPFTLFYSQMPWRDIFHMLPGENNPPLHFLLMHAWIQLVGIEPFQARLLSLIFGACSAVLIYLIGTRSFSRTVGISAALLFTFSNFNTYIAQEARVYSLFVLLSLISVFLFLKLIKEFRSKTLILLIVTNILLIYAHFFAFWIIFIEYLFFLSFRDIHTRLIKPFAIMAGALVVAFLPYLTIFIERFLSSSGGTWLEPPTISSLYNLLWKFCNQPVPTVMVILVLLLGLGRYVFLRLKGNAIPDRPTQFLILWFLLPTLLTFVLSFFLPVFYEKYLVFIAPAIYILACKSVEFIVHKKSVRIGILLVLITGFAVTSTPKPYYSRSVTSMVNDLKVLRNPNDPIVIIPGYYDKTFLYHYDREGFKKYLKVDETEQNNNLLPVYDPTTIFASDLLGCNKVFLIEAGSQYMDPSGLLFRQLNAHFDSIQTVEYSEVLKLYLFQKKNKK
ncbi:MAG: glycosyltransferase family 39 protein [Bacteroidales bacterium]|nr:glycosyltransferase family 39 protein [Bacteroidales bacterium]